MSGDKVQCREVHGNWRDELNDEELQYVTKVLDVRIDRQTAILSDTVADRRVYMERCIRRKRRREGKQ